LFTGNLQPTNLFTCFGVKGGLICYNQTGNMGGQLPKANETMLILASNSPRRRELLKRITSDFEVVSPDSDENIPLLPPELFVRKLARIKAESVFSAYPDAAVIGSDTVVTLGGKIYGKPNGREGAIAMLKELSGRTHEVYTAVCVMRGAAIAEGTERSTVTFARLSHDKIARYVDEFSPLDKAGSYGIQDGFGIVRKFTGSFENIMGFPVELVRSLLKEAGYIG